MIEVNDAFIDDLPRGDDDDADRLVEETSVLFNVCKGEFIRQMSFRDCEIC